MLPNAVARMSAARCGQSGPDVASLIRATTAPSGQFRGAQGTTTRSMSAMA
jgi:hypothetical protein